MLSFIAERSREEASALVRPAGETLTYASLAMAAAAVAQALEARVGDVAHRVVAIAAGDGAQRVASLLGVLESGGVALPVDARLGLGWARAAAGEARAVALIVGDEAEDRLDVEPVDPARVALPAESALILGRGAQRVVFTRAAIVAAVDALVQSQSLTAATRMALLAPGTTAAALAGQALATLRAGGTLLDVGRLEPAAQLETLARLDGNTLVGFPPQLDALARAVLDHHAPPPPLARIIVHAPLPSQPLHDELRRAFPQASLMNLHRSGDSLQFTTIATEAADGTVEVDGERVQPELLEAELRGRPGVREAALLVVPDARLGPRLTAFVAVAEGAEPPPAPPARVVPLLSLPHAPDGSIDRQALRRMASAE
jgi:acyl-coenzyme A synthetase/AMP-(fatty) acid ligase